MDEDRGHNVTTRLYITSKLTVTDCTNSSQVSDSTEIMPYVNNFHQGLTISHVCCEPASTATICVTDYLFGRLC